MAIHLEMSGLFAEEGTRALRLQDYEAALPRAARVRDAHLAVRPEWRGLGQREEFLAECRQRAQEVLDREDVDCFVVLGIGGSALGNQALLAALAPVYQEWPTASGRPRCLVPDSVDPDWIRALLEAVPADRCHFNVISKSGGTIETSAEFLVCYQAVREALGSDQAARARFTITTDPSQGHFRTLCNDLGFASLTIPPGVGGRFSVLTSVGLLTSEMAGIDSQSLLEGAARVDRNLAECSVEEDAAMAYALAHILHTEAGRPIHVHFPYSHRARLLADWYQQLWAESLGKKHDLEGQVVHRGATPVKAVGPTDQHSQVQLYTEGPDDKVFTLLRLGRFEREVRIGDPFVDSPAFEHLRGQELGALVEAERLGTEIALREAGRPVCTLELCKLDAFHVGQYFMFMQVATAYAGGLLNINPYDQPGVEAGKIAALALMGVAEHAARAAEIRRQQADRKSMLRSV